MCEAMKRPPWRLGSSVAIQHPGAPDAPTGVGEPGHLEHRHEGGHVEVTLRPGGVATHETDGQPTAFEEGDGRIVRRHHHAHSAPEVAEVAKCRVELPGRDVGVDLDARVHQDPKFAIGGARVGASSTVSLSTATHADAWSPGHGCRGSTVACR